MDKLLIKRGSKRALEQLDPLQVGELFLAKDEERLYVGGPRGNISIPTQKEVDEKATKTELQQVSLAYKESYDTLDDLKKAYPNGDIYNHVVLADGMIYTYVNGEWISTGVEANGAIEFMKDYEDLKALGVGRRNLLRNSKGPFIVEPKDSGKESDDYNFYRFYCDMELNETYTISADIEITHGDFDKVTVYPYPDGERSAVPIPSNGRIKHTFVKTSETTDSVAIYAGRIGYTRGNGIIIRNVKIEKGNEATDWTPAPEDIKAHPFVVELAETVFCSKQNEERIRALEEKLISN